MADSKINIGIIGAGRMGITHYSIINSHPDVKIVAVADPSSIVLTMMNKYLSVKTFADYNELFDKVKPDAVLVCTPPGLHHQIIKLAAAKGVHVFSEKPFTIKAADAAELTELYSNNGLVNQVGYVNRFNDIFVKVKQLVDSNVIGKPIRFKSEMFSCTITKQDDSGTWRGAKEKGGGTLFETASHAIDLINLFFGKADKVVGASLNSVYSKNVEDAVSATFLYKTGLSGTLYVNWSDTSYRKPTNKIEIFGTGGRILADQHALKIFLNADNPSLKLKKGWNTLYITDVFRPVPFYVRGNEFTRQLYHFIDCIQKRTKVNECSFADGLKTIQVIEAIYNDFEKNGMF